MRVPLALLLLAAGPALAEDLPVLTGAEIAEALTGATVDYAAAWQSFDASGSTTYHARGPSAGRWAVRGDLYCSQWPPSDGWDCYEVRGEGSRVVFIGAAGDETAGTIRE